MKLSNERIIVEMWQFRHAGFARSARSVAVIDDVNLNSRVPFVALRQVPDNLEGASMRFRVLGDRNRSAAPAFPLHPRRTG
jgi:hypothetical protein